MAKKANALLKASGISGDELSDLEKRSFIR
jgi:hypothetical protein